MLRTPVSQAVCILPTLPAPTSSRVPWATAQQVPAVVGSRLELVVVLLVHLVREAWLVDAVVAADAVVVVDVVVVVVVDVVEVVKKGILL